MGPDRSYLTAAENRSAARGTEFLKDKQRITVVLSCNADSFHMLPRCYIGKAETLFCFIGSRYSHVGAHYWSQTNAWMDSAGIFRWVRWWYGIIQQRSDGSWLLIVDNCGGHEEAHYLVYVLSSTVPFYCQVSASDLGLIGNSKVRYRSTLLRRTLNVMMRPFQPPQMGGSQGNPRRRAHGSIRPQTEGVRGGKCEAES